MKTRAAVLYEAGLSRPYADSEPLKIEELELAGPRRGEVLVEMAAGGLCHSDLSVINGSRIRPLPLVLGHEAAGVVREVGPGVEDLEEGDHVVFAFVPICGRCAACSAGRPSLCERGHAAGAAGQMLQGGRLFTDGRGRELNHHSGVCAFSEHTVADRGSVVRVDPELPLETAVLFGCAVMTGAGAVLNTARVPAGASVAVFGLGGVGLSAVMAARMAGAGPVVAVDPIAAKLGWATAAGATHTVDASAGDAAEAVRELTGGGAEFVFEAAGVAEAVGEAFRATRRGGTTVAIGLPHPEASAAISPLALVAEERSLVGSYMGSCVPGRDIPRFIELFRGGRLPVEQLRSRTIGLEEINAGFDALDRGEVARQVIRYG